MYCMSPWRIPPMCDIGNGRNEDCDRYVRRNGAYVKQIIVAQRKRVGLITRRTVDRNNPMILVCGRSAMQNRVVDKIQLDEDLNCCLLGATYFH